MSLSFYIYNMGQCEVTCVSGHVAPGMEYTFTLKVTEAPANRSLGIKVGDSFVRTMKYDPKAVWVSGRWEYGASYAWAYRYLDRHREMPHNSPFALMVRVMEDVAAGDVAPRHAADWLHETLKIKETELT
jgi:hypothetical protein